MIMWNAEKTEYKKYVPRKGEKEKIKDSYETFWTPESWSSILYKNEFTTYRANRHRQMVVDLLSPKRGDLILDAGCGYGRLTELLLSNGAEVYDVDISPCMIEHCRNKFLKNFKGLTGDVTCLPFDDCTFDKVLCNGVLVHVKDPGLAVENLVRVLKPGGSVLIDGNSLINIKVLYSTMIGKLHRFYYKIRSGLTESSELINKAYFPLYYRNLLRKQGCKIERILADTLFVFDFQIPFINRTFPPKFMIPFLSAFDRMSSINPFCYFGYEVWFLAKKGEKNESKAV